MSNEMRVLRKLSQVSRDAGVSLIQQAGIVSGALIFLIFLSTGSPPKIATDFFFITGVLFVAWSETRGTILSATKSYKNLDLLLSKITIVKKRGETLLGLSKIIFTLLIKNFARIMKIKSDKNKREMITLIIQIMPQIVESQRQFYQEARDAEKQEMILKMLEEHIEIETIARISGLTVEEISSFHSQSSRRSAE